MIVCVCVCVCVYGEGGCASSKALTCAHAGLLSVCEYRTLGGAYLITMVVLVVAVECVCVCVCVCVCGCVCTKQLELWG